MTYACKEQASSREELRRKSERNNTGKQRRSSKKVPRYVVSRLSWRVGVS